VIPAIAVPVSLVRNVHVHATFDIVKFNYTVRFSSSNG
jgi:hypothetical protein